MSNTGIYVEVDQADIRRVTSKLKNMEKAPRYLRKAINRTATEAIRKIKAGRSQGYTIKAGRFNQDIKVQRASVAHLDATIRSAGNMPTIKGNFKTSTPKKGAKADIVKTGLKTIQPIGGGGKAFVAPGGRAAGLIVRRKTKNKKPLEVIKGNSVPKMVEKIWEGERGGQGNLQESVQERLHEEMLTEIANIM